MKLKDVNGKLVTKNVVKYSIDWDGKSRSKYQFGVKQFLKPYWENNAVYEEFPVVGSRMTLDFYNHTKGIAIEMQGEFHSKISKFAHGTSSVYYKQLHRDGRKNIWCEDNDIILIEVFPKNLPLSIEFFNGLGVQL